MLFWKDLALARGVNSRFKFIRRTKTQLSPCASVSVKHLRRLLAQRSSQMSKLCCVFLNHCRKSGSLHKNRWMMNLPNTHTHALTYWMQTCAAMTFAIFSQHICWQPGGLSIWLCFLTYSFWPRSHELARPRAHSREPVWNIFTAPFCSLEEEAMWSAAMWQQKRWSLWYVCVLWTKEEVVVELLAAISLSRQLKVYRKKDQFFSEDEDHLC